MTAPEASLRRKVLRLAGAWAALIALMLCSLASAYQPLGPWNLVAGVAIAAAKSLIVLALFMGLAHAPALLRIAAALGFSTLALLFALSGFDYATRAVDPSPMQQPQQVEPAFPGGPSR